jgi:MFS family permease
MEIPSGALADLFGRRRWMILSFVSYIISFLVFGCTGMAASGGSLPSAAFRLGQSPGPCVK